ncbi:MAG TPA: ATP-binding cassette domain-containing protein [Tepidisphaeraceae bacterium]|nr:ATP-binding cassette domain-containing protein [Tepidisphaeraceae bacterium]
MAQTTNADLAIDLTHVAKIYRGKVHALQGINMQVRKGEIFGLLGPNGAGKSTLVKIMMTVVRPTQAQGNILGQPIGNKPTLAKVGYLPENHRFPRYLTARQTLEFFGAMCKVERGTAKRRADELLETVRMTDWADHKISTFSKGMLQRIGLAQSLMGDPDLVLLDEPTDGVDPVGRREILDAMGRLRDSGKTVFINSHALSELESICDRVAILVKGQVASQGTIDELTIARQRYEIEVAWTDPAAVRQKVLAGLPNAGWKPAMTSLPPPQMRQPPPLPAGAPVGAVPATPLNYVRPPIALSPGLSQRAIDKGSLPDGKWVELDGPVLRVGTTEPADMQPILDMLRGQGLIVRRMQPMRVSLEDLFIEAVTDPTTGGIASPGAQHKMKPSEGVRP